MKRFSFAAVAFFAATAPLSAASIMPSQFVIYGDSFIDAGNIAAATGNTIPDPALGYWYGRFSDGPTWADYLSYASLGKATKASLTGGTNFAFGAARGAQDDIISLDPFVAIPGLATQIALSGVPFVPAVDPNAFFIINFGNNDVNAINGTDADREGLTVAQYQAAYVANMVGAVLLLDSKGAGNILVAGVPNPLDPQGQFLQSLLDAQLDLIEPTLNATLFRFDYFNFFFRLQADPTAFGLPSTLNFTDSCLATVGPGQDCSNFLSFDGIHVTRGVQQAISIEISRLTGLAAVPEPATWGMMIAGFGLVGAALRRQRRVATPA